MKTLFRYITPVSVLFIALAAFWSTRASTSSVSIHRGYNSTLPAEDTVPEQDSIAGTLPFPFNDNTTLPYQSESPSSPLFLSDSSVHTDIEYNPENNSYEFRQKIGKLDYRQPYSMNLDEYRKYDFENAEKAYWRQRFKSEIFQTQTSLIPQLHVGSEIFETIFGSNTIEIRPQGSAGLKFGARIDRIDNPQLPARQRRSTSFDFKEDIQMSVNGKIGENMELGVEYNTEATFAFENKMKLKYEGKEDDIIQRIEAGDVSLPLPGTLINGSQSLFGILTELKFGKLYVTSVVSQQESESKTIEVQGGAQRSTYELDVDDYDANKHYFLAHYFQEEYDRALSNLPVPLSGIKITRIEVWITNRELKTENTRNIIAFADLAEAKTTNKFNPDYFPNTDIVIPPYIPFDSANTLYSQMAVDTNYRDIYQINTILQNNFPNVKNGKAFEKLENARRLNANEYKLNAQLGYISLNSALNPDDVLAVAYEYTYNGVPYTVGDFTTDGITGKKALFVKLLKSTNVAPVDKTWKLMMKNIYSIGAYQVNKDQFQMNIKFMDLNAGGYVYALNSGAIKGKKLLRVFNLDNMDVQNVPQVEGDGVFDFIEGYTILPSSGKIIFPMVEPFGQYLYNKLLGDENTQEAQDTAEKYSFRELYDSTLTKARQSAKMNRYILEGQYLSSGGSEISLNAPNVPQGSVKVIAGGQELVEGQDYTVDYTMGKVNIINQGILESGVPIKISMESNSMFSIQSKRFLGTHLEYKFNDDISIGGTILNLNEKPMTTKVNIGDEPISNTLWGLNGSYKAEVPLITRLVDKIPLIDTKETSYITFNGEFAQLVPGHSKAITKNGESYIDDFEGSKSTYPMYQRNGWFLASTPQHQPGMFPEAELNSLDYGFRRAKLSWYNIDPQFYESGSDVPSSKRKSIYVDRVREQVIFSQKSSVNQQINYLTLLDLAYYPDERGPYNFSTAVSPNGLLNNPSGNWGGIMREVDYSDFEALNIEYIEFWMLDPYAEDEDSGLVRNDSDPALYFNLGSISEDILKDGRKSFECGLPDGSNNAPVDTTIWGVVPVWGMQQAAFTGGRDQQDVGLDGLNDSLERKQFRPFLNELNRLNLEAGAYQKIYQDPSSDHFYYYRDARYSGLGILERYKEYSNPEANSQASGNIDVQSSTNTPDIEDINLDNTLSETESYYQYKLSLKPEDLALTGVNYLVDIVPAGSNPRAKWYHFKIPVAQPDSVINDIQDFRSIRFLRMFVKGLENKAVFRFANLAFVRGDWRKYDLTIMDEGEYPNSDVDLSAASYEISTVSVEENSGKTPIPYCLPPGVIREQDPSNPSGNSVVNEQSLVLKVVDLNDGYSKAAYKNVNIDARQYKRLQMEVHAEDSLTKNNELTVFIRLGSDYSDNYYEYEIPLKITPDTISYNRTKDEDRRAIWPLENRFDFPFEVMLKAKQERNNASLMANSTVFLTSIYSIKDGKNTVKVKGNPSLSNIKVIMLGVRNPKDKLVADPKSVEVWFDELRLTDFNEDGGWAANARFTAKLADFGSISVSGYISTPGFGSIEKKVSERSKEEMKRFDISSNFELGKFFPEKMKVKIPLFAGYSQKLITPKFNPLDADIPMNVSIKGKSQHDKDSILNMSESLETTRSLNFMNVGIQPEGESHFYSVSNWSASYAYTDLYARNINIEFNKAITHNGSINYVFNNNPKNISPLKNSKIFRGPAFSIIRDINFYYAPKMISFRSSMNRRYSETQLRNINNLSQRFDISVSKQWLWNREYDLKYDITRSLKFDFSATNEGRVSEPQGRIDKEAEDYHTVIRHKIDSSLMRFGTTTNYNHRLNLTYTIPINKIPGFAWVSANARYGATYDWEKGPQTVTANNYGNVIQNSNTKQLSTQYNFQALYSKVKFLDRIDKKYKKSQKDRNVQKKYEDVTFVKENVDLKANQPRLITHNLGLEDVKIKVMSDTSEITVKLNIVNEKRITITADKDYNNLKVTVTGKREVTDNPLVIALEQATLVLMGVKNIQIGINETNGTILPGYMGGTHLFGSEAIDAPGLPFIAGIQDPEFAMKMGEKIKNQKSLLSTDSSLNAAFLMTYSENITIKVTIEPLPGFKIDVTGTRNYSLRNSKYYRFAGENIGFREEENGSTTSGNYSITFNSIRTAFDKHSDTYKVFENILYDIGSRLMKQRNPNFNTGTDSIIGYGRTSQEVIIPAFMAAYSGGDKNKITLKSFPGFMAIKPNWRINYDGLAKLDAVKKYFKSIVLTHAYNSTFSMGSFTSNLKYIDNGNGFTNEMNLEGNYQPRNIIGAVSINEAFAPLIGIDATLNNSMLVKLEFKQTRNLTFSMSNYTLNEIYSKETVFGTGYRIENVPVIINGKKITSDVNLRLDVSIRNNNSNTRKLVEKSSQPLAGQKVLSIKWYAEYMVSSNLTVRAYFERLVTTPQNSSSYKNANTIFGFNFRFTLSTT